MKTKLDNARGIVAKWLETATAPIVAWSSGKDSMVLLALVREVNPNVPVMFLKQSNQQKKNAFAQKIIRQWKLTAPVFRPLYREAIAKGSQLEIVEAYPAGLDACFYLPLEAEANLDESRPFICGYERLAEPVSAQNEFLYDVTFIGHRADDADPLHGALPLRGGSAILGATVLVYPFWDWTVKDIWDASEELGVPQNQNRYDLTARRERLEMAHNNDYHNMCTRCLAPGLQTRLVPCPKRNGNVFYLGDLLPSEQRRNSWRENFVNIQPARKE